MIVSVPVKSSDIIRNLCTLILDEGGKGHREPSLESLIKAADMSVFPPWKTDAVAVIRWIDSLISAFGTDRELTLREAFGLKVAASTHLLSLIVEAFWLELRD